MHFAFVFFVRGSIDDDISGYAKHNIAENKRSDVIVVAVKVTEIIIPELNDNLSEYHIDYRLTKSRLVFHRY